MSILNLIGQTPIIYLEKLSKELNVNIYLKAEMFNPGASIKDRASYAYIKNALSRNELRTNGTVVEASSGNLGIGLATVCKAYELNLKICMPQSASLERRKLIQALGAELILTPANLGMGGAIEKAKQLLAESSNTFFPNQFENTDGPKIHYETTGQELVNYAKDNNISIDAFVAGVGSGATFSGVGKAILEHFKAYLCPVEPEESAVLSGEKAGLHGIQGIGAGFIPKVMNLEIANEIIKINTKQAIDYAKQLREYGINAGISSGANLAAAIILAKRPEFKGKNIFSIACDTGERYLSTDLFL